MIIFENLNLVAVDKPAGMLSVPSRDRQDSRGIVGLELQQQLKTQLFPIHRLDFEVSGILLFAKNSQTHKRWQDLFQSRKVEKTYEAISVHPDSKNIPEKFRSIFQSLDLKAEESKWECRLEKGKRRVFEANRGKASVTLARVLREVQGSELVQFTDDLSGGQSLLLWQMKPITGRSHQLRYELFRHGCPILGDALYGSQVRLRMHDQILLRHTGFVLKQETDGLTALEVPSLLKILQSFCFG